MHPIFLSGGSLNGLAVLAPYILVPAAILIGAPSIPAIRYLYRKPGFANGLALLVLGALNLGLGLIFVGIMHDVCPHPMDNEGPKSYLALALLAYLCGAVMAVAGGLAVGKVISVMYSRAAQAMKERVGE